MKILIVCSGNKTDFSFEKNQPFIFDQVNAIMAQDNEINFSYFFIRGKGIGGYLKNLGALKQQIKDVKPDLIHAHYAFSGLLANLQRKVGVITTFHGTDINDWKIRIISKIVHLSGVYSIIVSEKMVKKLRPMKRFSIIPCGVDMDVFYPMNREQARKQLGLDNSKRYILFSSSFQNQVKNYPLAKEAFDRIGENNTVLLEFSGYSRNESALLFNAVDVALMTSYSEGSPQFIKEAMACNCPVVATDVGDIKQVIADTKGCFLTTFDPTDVAAKLELALNYGSRTGGRVSIGHLDNQVIARHIIEIYKKVVA